MNTLARKNEKQFFDSVFSNFFGQEFWPENNNRSIVPATNIRENAEKFSLELIVPGFKKEDFTIELDNQYLNISAERKSEDSKDEGDYKRKEFHFSSTKRSFRLPENIATGEIHANYEDGILTVDLPKKAKDEPAKKLINIS